VEFASQVVEMKSQVVEIGSEVVEIPPEVVEKCRQVVEKFFYPMVVQSLRGPALRAEELNEGNTVQALRSG